MRPALPVVPASRLRGTRTPAVLLSGGVALVAALAAVGPASAAQVPVDLGTATSYAVLAGSTVTNTGVSNISGDLGVSPGTAVVGFPPGLVTGGVIHAGDANAAQAEQDLVTAYDTAAGETPQTPVGPDLAGQTLVAGIYGNSNAAGTLGLTGTLTLDGKNDPNGLFVFQADSTLITASGASVRLINGANPCNVYWKVGSSATLGTSTEFVGNILALTSISLDTDANVQGRVLARNGAVTLDSNDVSRPSCAATPTGGGGGATPTAAATPTAGTTGTPTGGTTPTTPTTPAASPSGSTGGTTTQQGASVSGSKGPGSHGPGSGTGRHGTGSGSGLTSTPTGARLTTVSVIPPGHPETGLGGAAAGGPDSRLLALGGTALAGAAVAASLAARRRRVEGRDTRS
jgi:hypothetical protein